MRTVLTLVFLALAPAASAAIDRQGKAGIIFPVVGGADYTDDFGDPRPQGRHDGNDLLAPRGTPVVAVADGVVKLHVSGRGGYMLYLRNRRYEWLYIHLGKAGGGSRTAFARGLKTGMRVRQGQILGYVGDSGDAAGGPTHLHFEEHSARGRHFNPYRRLRAAPIPIMFAPLRRPVALVPGTALQVNGRLAFVLRDDGGLRVGIRSTVIGALNATPGVARRVVVLKVSPEVEPVLATLAEGASVHVETVPEDVTIRRLLAAPGSWTAASITPLG